MSRIRFPHNKQRPSFGNKIKLLVALLILLGFAWGYSQLMQEPETVITGSAKPVRASDGDSFSIGKEKLRLRGIDAPELKQTCKNQTGQDWACGTASHGGLVQLLSQPGLSCKTDARDRFGRALAACSTSETEDIAAAQVATGYAISQKFNGIRDYPREEDAARKAKRGIWRGKFTRPRKWRDQNPRILKQ